MSLWRWTTWCLPLLALAAPRALHAQAQKLPAPPPPPVHPDRPYYSLEQFEQMADTYNPILARDRAGIEAARGTAIQAGLMPNPAFNTGNPFVFSGRNSLPNFGLQQEIPVMGKLRLDTAAAQQTTRQAEEAYWQNRSAMKTAIRQQYYTILAIQARIDWYDRYLAAGTELYNIARAQVEQEKKSSASDLSSVLIDLQRAGAIRRALALRLNTNRREMAYTVGNIDLPLFRVYGTLNGPYPSFDEAAVLKYVASRNSQVRIAESVLAQAKVQLERARVSWVPNPTLGPAYQWGTDSSQTGNNQFWFNLTFGVPLWHQNQGLVYSARASVTSAEEALRVTQNNLQAKVLDLLSLYHAALEKVLENEHVVLATARQAAIEAREAVQKDPKQLGSQAQVFRLWLQTENEFIDSQLELWNAVTEIAGYLQLEKFPLNIPTEPPKNQ